MRAATKIFRCYRCNELRNGKPKMIINEKPLCALCVEQPHHIHQEAVRKS